MKRASLHLLKGTGYLVSTVSVVLLAIVSWSNASKDLLLTACLLAGAATSVAGMFCRWLSYEIEKRKEERFEKPSDQAMKIPMADHGADARSASR